MNSNFLPLRRHQNSPSVHRDSGWEHSILDQGRLPKQQGKQTDLLNAHKLPEIKNNEVGYKLIPFTHTEEVEEL